MTVSTVDVYGAPAIRQCSRCGECRDADDFLKGRRLCMPCAAKYAREWRAANPERCRLNAERHRALPGQREAARLRTAAWRTADPARARASERRWHTENRETHRSAKRSWKAANKEKVAASGVAYRLSHPEEYKAQRKRWREQNPEKWRDLRRGVVARRRALKKGAAWVEHIDRQTVWNQAGGMCGICGVSVEAENFHVDHIIPLARGGEHSYANVQAAHPRCNMVKGWRK